MYIVNQPTNIFFEIKINFIFQVHFFILLHVLNKATNGTVVASSHSDLIGEDVSSMRWFQEGLTEGVYFGVNP
jgi:hypothetical protein